MSMKIYGVGINDADYVTQPTINGKQVGCKYYMTWKSMLQRCYHTLLLKKCPTYNGCLVANEWHYFMRFREWMMTQEWGGLDLDKDILVPGNKIYSPDTCCFVSHEVNSLLTDRGAARGKYPQGVTLYKRTGKFRAQISIYGKGKYLGDFDAPEEAEAAYIKAKVCQILKIADEQSDPRIKQGLINHAALL